MVCPQYPQLCRSTKKWKAMFSMCIINQTLLEKQQPRHAEVERVSAWPKLAVKIFQVVSNEETRFHLRLCICKPPNKIKQAQQQKKAERNIAYLGWRPAGQMGHSRCKHADVRFQRWATVGSSLRFSVCPKTVNIRWYQDASRGNHTQPWGSRMALRCWCFSPRIPSQHLGENTELWQDVPMGLAVATCR